jgi:hypothetical protein
MGTSGPFREVFRRNGSLRNSGVPPEETATELCSAHQHWYIPTVLTLWHAFMFLVGLRFFPLLFFFFAWWPPLLFLIKNHIYVASIYQSYKPYSMYTVSETNNGVCMVQVIQLGFNRYTPYGRLLQLGDFADGG